METLASTFQITCTRAVVPVARNLSFSKSPKHVSLTRCPLLSGNTLGRRALQRLKSTEIQDPQLYADYSSQQSVFPAEACEDIGGDACDVNMGPEAKLPPRKEVPVQRPEGPDRETMSYDGPKTVFPGEACDELGGEFCEPSYQEGVGKVV